MATHVGHVRAGVLFYAGFLAGAFALSSLSNQPTFEWVSQLLPFGASSLETVIGFGSCGMIALLAALWPDVDIKSLGQIVFYRLFVAFDLLLIILYYTQQNLRYLESAAFLGFVAMFPLIGKHRGWTHSHMTMLLLPLPLLVVPMVMERRVLWVGLPYYIAAFLGYASHLFMDGLLFGLRKP